MDKIKALKALGKCNGNYLNVQNPVEIKEHTTDASCILWLSQEYPLLYLVGYVNLPFLYVLLLLL